MGKSWTLYKKLHRWPGLIISFILFYYGITGIIMNHRELLSGVDLNRNILPDNYLYKNWNNAALKGDLIINHDSILVFGNIGVWLTDSSFRKYTSFNSGFPAGSDNRKIFDLHRTKNGDLYAAAFSGLYGYDNNSESWYKFNTGTDEKRFTGLESIGDTIFAVNRSYLFKGISRAINTDFTQIMLPPPPGYEHKVTLFETIWQIHSGEILGLPGKIYVDILGIVIIFLSATGIIYFFFPGWIKRRLKRGKKAVRLIKTGRWSLFWHNKAGAWTFILLILLFLTGMFLRPPLLIAIGEAEILPLKYSNLNQPNPWYDKLRDILYDPGRDLLLLSAYDGVYYMNTRELMPVEFKNQPPVSIMGINVFENSGDGDYLIGSFTGLFTWNPERPEIYNLATGALYNGTARGRPVGDYLITGILKDAADNLYMVDYDLGVQSLDNNLRFPGMPENVIRDSNISLWGACLEIHTGRIYENLAGDFYILIVPLCGIAGITVVISGYILWRRKYRKKGYDNVL